MLPRLTAEPTAVRTPLTLLAAAVGLVAVADLRKRGGLLLGEAAARTGEMATRAALGAGSLRLIRQLLAENLVISALAAALGIAIAQVGIRVLLALAPDALPRADAGLNPVALGFALGVTLLVAMAVGLAPALAARRSAGMAGAHGLVVPPGPPDSSTCC
ncbi:MAG: FtsX-like permease family protein [Longimicrobiales bacterium]